MVENLKITLMEKIKFQQINETELTVVKTNMRRDKKEKNV